jgi:hypothetical protein
MADIDGNARFNFLELEGDYDVLRRRQRSSLEHARPHARAFVDEDQLASGKSIIMSQDAIWMQENLTAIRPA